MLRPPSNRLKLCPPQGPTPQWHSWHKSRGLKISQLKCEIQMVIQMLWIENHGCAKYMIYIYVYVYIHIHINIYIYIYMFMIWWKLRTIWYLTSITTPHRHHVIHIQFNDTPSHRYTAQYSHSISIPWMFMDWMATRKHPTHVFAGGTHTGPPPPPHLWYGRWWWSNARKWLNSMSRRVGSKCQ